MPTPIRRTLIGATTIALALAGCTAGTEGDGPIEPAGREATVAPENENDGDASGSPDTETDGDTADEAADAPDAEQTDQVAIDDFRFSPEAIEVTAGTTVTFSNEDATAHTVTRGSDEDPQPDAFDERVDEKGQTIEWTFDEPGTYAYFCELHPFMEGTVTVTG